MEALPIMPMLAPQSRSSTLSYDNIPNFDFRLRMKEYILLTFNADPHDYDSAFDELTQMKFEANVPTPSVEQTLKLKRYYGQLCMMQKRFPMGAGEQLETPFAWHDGLIDIRSAQSEVTICDIEFEKASVMFNIGACHAQYAAEQTRDTQDCIKAAFMHFQYAAYAFEQLNSFRNSDIFYPSVDLDANVISFYYKVMIAQAQECLVQKSLLDNRSAIVIAKLSLWLQEAYDSAAKIVDEWSVNIPESVQRYYAKICSLKSAMYAVIAYMSFGDNLEKEDKKMGWRLQYYNIANKYMELLSSNHSKMRERYPELFVTSSFLFDVISAKQRNAEKENDFIYHDRVPKQEDAIDAVQKDGGGAMCKVKTLSFDPLDPSVCGCDLFGKLLPTFVQDAVKKYSDDKDQALREIKECVRSYDEHLNYQLQLAEFDKLRFMLNEGKRSREAWFEISEDLMKRNADMTSYPDCVPNLIDKMGESSDTARVAEAKLNTLLSKLRAIDLQKSSIRSDEGFILIQKELERLAEHLEQAKAHNVSLNKAIAQHSANLQLLTLPCREMWMKIVPPEQQGEMRNGSSPEELQVRKMIEKVMEMQAQRRKLVEQFEADLKADNISNKLMGTNERGAEEIMKSELTKHTNIQQLIRLNITAQDAILRAFADANADFFEERLAMSTKKEEYEKRVSELCASYEVYRDVSKKVDEGEQFYRQLMARCDQFAIPVHAMEEQYREEMEKKERAKKEAEHHLNQIRMSRDAQNALMDFGGGRGGGAPGARAQQQAYQPSRGAAGAGAGAPRGPRLGDFMDSYRARKQAPQAQIPEDQGPPSPTPSSICDFPVQSQRSQRFGAFEGAQGAPGAQRGYQGPHSPVPGALTGSQASGPFGAPPGAPHGYGAPLQAPPQAPYGYDPSRYQDPSTYPAPPPILPGSAAYEHAIRPYPGDTGSYQVPRIVPGAQYGAQAGSGAYFGAQFGAQGAQGAHFGAQGVQFGAQGAQGAHFGAQGAQGAQFGAQGAQGEQFGAQGAQGAHFGAQGAQGAHFGAQGAQGTQFGAQGAQGPPPASYGAPTPPQASYGPAPGAHGYQNGAQGPPGAEVGAQGPPGAHFGAHGASAPPPTSYGAPTPQRPPQASYGAAPGAQGPPGGQFEAHGAAALPPTSHGAPTPQGPFGAAPGAQFGAQGPYGQQGARYEAQKSPGAAIFGAPGAPPQHQGSFGAQFGVPPPQNSAPGAQFGAKPEASSHAPTPPPQPHPSYQAPAPPPALSVFQHSPQGAPITAPPPASSHHEHIAAPQARFTPTPGAPSPWHATPAELKTPWNTTPQYHAPPGAQAAAPEAPAAPAPGAPAARSNVDLLSDLLGDFNLPPQPIQPTVHSTQQLQHQAPQQQEMSDFRIAAATLNPPPESVKPVKPAAAVQPMPQMTAQQVPAHGAQETPILKSSELSSSASTSSSITELSDPSKFQLGVGNVQKLEKRMLHQSFRNQGPPPPMNQSDPLNQIDAFSSFMTPRHQ
ncbi:BRO1 domain-containing protein [Caenorhabditis elegans]|uniref:BRO1 domain-containing protein n=1 Tax=Caenorhabditis elegans TaxID=6239 RepID=G5EBN5_CAEEL|nr:BRO1 domain-containing protein [Caenorhabditis elegans]ABN54457.1 enhancer of glp-1 [Caenorhabditis elegans]CAL64007.2 BRO1 domain-containing protein [Caenorhabditis elegans]|eukprot:NP_001076622.2 Enhancer of Glp-One (glp-1) [Caenorhabditis elegans]